MIWKVVHRVQKQGTESDIHLWLDVWGEVKKNTPQSCTTYILFLLLSRFNKCTLSSEAVRNERWNLFSKQRKKSSWLWSNSSDYQEPETLWDSNAVVDVLPWTRRRTPDASGVRVDLEEKSTNCCKKWERNVFNINAMRAWQSVSKWCRWELFLWTDWQITGQTDRLIDR